MSHRLVILGAGYAGLAAARRAAARLRRPDVRVTLVNATDRFVERVRLHQLAVGQDLREHPLAPLAAAAGIELVVARVTSVDLATRTVRLDAAPHAVGYDTLVYALGSGADTAGVPGVAEHALTVAETEQAERVRAHVATLPSGGVVAVVGGGLTGIEIAAELAESHPRLRVELLTSGGVGDWLCASARDHLRRAFDRLGVGVHEDSRVVKVGEGALLLDDGRDRQADAVVWAAGFRVPDLAARAGLAVDDRGRMVVDETLRSVSHPDVYGIGDAAAAAAIDGAETRLSCQTALPMGLYVADAITDVLTGRTPKPVRVRYFWQNVSLGRRDGVTQFTRADDSPVDRVLTGRVSARFKEVITRGAAFSARRPGPYLPHRRRAPRSSA
ncbi:NADH dehydrogenase, FAD-containing subunit [Streptoalloteichus tenebrarius]|uniref:NADH dehydrogenase, FAD-containing subunit n=1 Tax=Streptoalloteichus tenebrarius (strain ATCC 17920 / DSM 40477 / JCM 4838 / CBS 697.72 / NBRC 16177 / NCIMB 11028 / NRRL B-12390 / A12253. 1 / ISP 5477) TaxID=1933 RepID=A0ABT1HUN1_STRSD|nr:FAD-dependent oxidoreductase [Streptoalloteichus tenebrarius]MCP2259206.1 NADH dehydrogenase, FAD-containing subunit [Streptoalloteichus tenebrarius]